MGRRRAVAAEDEAGDSVTGDTAPQRVAVLALLDALGLAPDPSEVDLMAERYPATRAMVEQLYAMPGVRYEEPAATFDPRTPPR
jgi:hypothetical protein